MLLNSNRSMKQIMRTDKSQGFQRDTGKLNDDFQKLEDVIIIKLLLFN